MRHVKFMINDGSTVDIEIQPKFEQIVREKLGLATNAHVSDADIKRFFIASMAKASE